MPYEALDTGRWAVRPDLPQPDRARVVASGEQVPIRTPGQRGDRAGMRHLLEECAQLRIPEPDGRIKSPTCQQASIGGKGQCQKEHKFAKTFFRGKNVRSALC